VGGEVDLAKARTEVVPLGEGADRDPPAQDRSGFGARASLDLQASALRREHSVDRRGGHLEELRAELWVQRQLAVALQGLDGLGHERRQALACRAFKVAHTSVSGAISWEPYLLGLARCCLAEGGRAPGQGAAGAGASVSAQSSSSIVPFSDLDALA
jgi:hypothetical protein